MRIAVIGGTGLAGRHTVDVIRAVGHDPVSVARSRGVDVVTGAGLDDALAGVDAVIDVTSTNAIDPATAEQFFGTATQNLLAAEQRAGVRHHVLLSIIGIDGVKGNAHYHGKRRQEHLVESGPVPWTIQRAAQFFDFAGQVVSWTMTDGVATIPPLLVQPVAVAEVAAVLTEVATAEPRGRAADLAGPEPQDLVDMARRTLAVLGTPARLVPSWQNGILGVEMAGEVLLPGPAARLGETTFDAWLAQGARS